MQFIKPLLDKKEEFEPVQLELPLPENMPYIVPTIEKDEVLKDYEIYGC